MVTMYVCVFLLWCGTKNMARMGIKALNGNVSRVDFVIKTLSVLQLLCLSLAPDRASGLLKHCLKLSQSLSMLAGIFQGVN